MGDDFKKAEVNFVSLSFGIVHILWQYQVITKATVPIFEI